MTVEEITNQLGAAVAGINWAEPTWDLFIVLFFIVAALIYGFSLGRDRIITILISIYIALAVVSYAPFINSFGTAFDPNQAFAAKVGSFLVVFIILFFFTTRSALIRTLGSNRVGAWWQVLAFSILQVGLLISVTLSFLPADAVNTLSPVTKNIFISDVGRLCWVLLPVILMVIIPADDDD